MSASITALEDERRELLGEVRQLGDFRPDSISTIQGRCGEPACRCHQPGQPPPGPHFRLTRKVRGKTVSETFSSPAARRKAPREVGQFHRFQQLCGALLASNEKICRRRPVEEQDCSPAQQEKKRPRPSGNKSARRQTSCGGCSSPPGASREAGIWKPWRWPPEPLYTKRVRRCWSSYSLANRPRKQSAPAAALSWPVTVRCARTR